MRQKKQVTLQFSKTRVDMHGRTLRLIAVFAAVVILGGCAGSAPQIPKLSEINPFAEKAPPPLKGKRISVLPQKSASNGLDMAASRPVTLPLPIQNASWSQPGGTPSNAPGHLLLGPTLKRVWRQSAGSGSSSYGRLTTSPIVAGGRVFTLDAAAKLTAFSLANGSPTWRLDLTPQKESSTEGYGGGLAVDAGRLYAATGFGKVLALEPATGRVIWERSLRIPARTSPTAAQNKLFVITTSGRFFCLDGNTGETLWDYRGPSETTQISSNPSPAVSGKVVTVPYPNGDLVALDIDTGRPLWSDSLARTRSSASFALMSDAARPAMADGKVYAVGHGGRMVATDQTTGERLWALNVPSTQTPWVAGEHVFVVDTGGKLSAISREDGQFVWTVKLPGSRTWSGPTLAGGALWLASNKGGVVGVDAVSGRVTRQFSVGAAVYIAPVVANGAMLIMTDAAELIAFR